MKTRRRDERAWNASLDISSSSLSPFPSACAAPFLLIYPTPLLVSTTTIQTIEQFTPYSPSLPFTLLVFPPCQKQAPPRILKSSWSSPSPFLSYSFLLTPSFPFLSFPFLLLLVSQQQVPPRILVSGKDGPGDVPPGTLYQVGPKTAGGTGGGGHWKKRKILNMVVSMREGERTRIVFDPHHHTLPCIYTQTVVRVGGGQVGRSSLAGGEATGAGTYTHRAHSTHSHTYRDACMCVCVCVCQVEGREGGRAMGLCLSK